MPVTQDEVLSALKQCYDPEIPVNIVDLGLIYEVRFAPAPEDKQDVTVDMTLTAQGCPAHVQISDQVRARLEQLPGVRTANVNIVWTPAWTPERRAPQRRRPQATRYRVNQKQPLRPRRITKFPRELSCSLCALRGSSFLLFSVSLW